MLSMREEGSVEVSYQKVLAGNLISSVLMIQWMFYLFSLAGRERWQLWGSLCRTAKEQEGDGCSDFSFSNRLKFCKNRMKKNTSIEDTFTGFVLCSSSPGTISLGEWKPYFLVPCPAGLRGRGSYFCRQSKILHGSSPSLSIIMCFHFPSVQLLLQMLLLPHPALEFRMHRYFEHLMQVVCVSKTEDLESLFPLITLCFIVHKICLTTRDEVKNDVIVMEPLISTVTVNIQVENCNNSLCSHLHMFHKLCTKSNIF